MNRQRHGLLLELIFVCGFFILASCIFVLVYFKAGQLSTLSRDTSAAGNAAQTTLKSPSIPATARRKSSTACPPTGISARRTPWKRDRIRHT